MIGRIAAGVCAGLLFFFAALVIVTPNAVPTGRIAEVAVDAADIRPEIGHAFAFRVPRWLPEDSRSRSSLALFEDGKPLIPHALHDSIRTAGKGLYSHWGRQVYFSAFDNSDPRSNGRSYRYRVAEALSPLWGVGALLLGLLLLVRLRCGAFAVMAGAGAGGLAACFLLPAETMATLVNGGIMAALLAIWPVVCWSLGSNGARRDWIRGGALSLVPMLVALGYSGFASIAGIVWPRFLTIGQLPAGFTVVSFLAFCAAARDFAPVSRIMRRVPAASPAVLTACLAVVAIAPRLSLLVLNWDASPVWDAQGYDLITHAFAQTLSIPHDIDSMPGMIVVNGLIYAAFGHYWGIARVFNLLLNLATGVLFAHAARIGTGSRTAGLLTFLVFGVSVEVFRLDHLLLTETLFQFFIAALLWCLVAYVVWRKPLFAAMGGAAAAGVILTRLQGAGLVAGAVAVLILLVPGAMRRRVGVAALLLATMLLLILPWGAWNAAERGRFSFGSGQESSAFWIHNHPDAPHGLVFGAQMSGIWAKEVHRGEGRPTAERVAQLNRNAWDFYRHNPMVFLERALDRQFSLLSLIPDAFFVSPVGWKPAAMSEFRSVRYWAVRLDKIVFLLLMAAALVLRRDKTSLVSLLLFAGYAAPISLYSVPDQRIRWPVYMLMALPYVIYAAGAARSLALPEGRMPPSFSARRILIGAALAAAVWMALHLAWGRHQQFPALSLQGAIPASSASGEPIPPDGNAFLGLPSSQWMGRRMFLSGRVSPYFRRFEGYPFGNPYDASPFLIDARHKFYLFNGSEETNREVKGSQILMSFDGCAAEEGVRETEFLSVAARVEGWALRLDDGRLANLWLRCIRAEKKR